MLLLLLLMFSFVAFSAFVLQVYVKDTKSSNGTYLNEKRLSNSGMESEPFELKTGARAACVRASLF